MGLQHIFLL